MELLEITERSREAGDRTRLLFVANNPNVDAIGGVVVLISRNTSNSTQLVTMPRGPHGFLKLEENDVIEGSRSS